MAASDSHRQESKVKIRTLVHSFLKNINYYKQGSYSEAQVRQEYINPLFEALGWRFHGLNPQEAEVIPESRLRLYERGFSFQLFGQTEMWQEGGEASRIYQTSPDELFADPTTQEEELKQLAFLARKRPDYGFRAAGKFQFFVEAKRPSKELTQDADAIFQAKRYAFSSRETQSQ
jgi:hypothetical protein